MQDFAFLAAVIFVGLIAAILVCSRARRINSTRFIVAFVSAYISMLTFAFVLNVFRWQHGHLYLGSNSMSFLASLLFYKTPGLLILSAICLSGPALMSRLRRSS